MLVRLDPASVGAIRDLPRPRHRRPEFRGWPGLWPRLALPTTERGLLLWRDGRVLVVESWDSLDLWESADDHVAGGHEWIGDDQSWQGQVLAAAGFVLTPIDAAAPPPPPPPVDTFTPTFEPTF